MKKIMLVLSLSLALTMLCSCGEKQTTDVTNNAPVENTVVSSNENDNDYLEAALDFDIQEYSTRDFGNIKLYLKGDTAREIDNGYAIEYYKIIKSKENEDETMFSTVDNGDFPALVVMSKGTITAYEYKDGKVSEVNSSNLDLQKAVYRDVYTSLSLFENAIINQLDIYSEYKEIKESGVSFEDIMNEYKNSEDGIFYGSDYHGEEFEDGTMVERSTEVMLGEDNNLYLKLYDSSIEKEKQFLIKGIEGNGVYGAVYIGDTISNENNPSLIYELTEKGDVYAINLKDVSISGSAEEVIARKISSVSNAIMLCPMQDYPTYIGESDQDLSSYYALTFDGNLIPLK
jgi:hypothetical protein